MERHILMKSIWHRVGVIRLYQK